jgi:Tetratricopeptide repeat
MVRASGRVDAGENLPMATSREMGRGGVVKGLRAFHKGLQLQQQGNWRASIAAYDRALRKNPQLGEAHLGRGASLHYLRRYDEALAEYAKAGCRASQMNAANIHLLRGNYERGLALLRARCAVKDYGCTTPYTLSDLRGKDVFIMHESPGTQGYGDSIHMSRFLPAVTAAARSVHWATGEPVIPLLAFNFPSTSFFVWRSEVDLAFLYGRCRVLEFDLWQTASPDLTICGKPYLRADPQRVAEMQRRLPAGRRIGLSSRSPNDPTRSAGLCDFLPVIPDGAVPISLQKDLRDDERPHVFDGGALFTDFTGSAALVACLDALITVDTATARLGGALGVRTRVAVLGGLEMGPGRHDALV